MGSKLKVLHVSKFYYPTEGGIEYFVKDLCEELLKKQIHVAVLAHNKIPFYPIQNQNINNVQVLKIPIIANISYAPISVFFCLT